MGAKKHLGQHFLTSKAALRDIIQAAAVGEKDTILEIGPGKGVLTRALLETGARVVAIETDADMIAVLETTFEHEINANTLILVHADVLDIPLTEKYLASLRITQYKLVANISYYITGEILRRFLTAQAQPESITVLVQKEVAERIARSTKETILSLSVKAYGVPRYVATVPARYFNPPPKVDSAILHIASISKRKFENISEDRFFKIVRAGFANKRKKVVNNLSVFGTKDDITTLLHQLGFTENVRAEEIPLASWFALAEKLDN